MVLILSDGVDKSVNTVVRYLYLKNAHPIVIQNSDISTIIQLSINEFTIFREQNISSDKISSYWFRRGQLNIENNIIDCYQQSPLINYIRDFGKNEIGSYISYIYYLLEKKKSIGSIFKSEINKLYVLRCAELCGLSTPNTLVATNSDSLLCFGDESLLIKSGSKFFSYTINNLIINSYSSLVKVNSLPESFFPNIFQNYIEKQYEIRSFFLINEFYSMAIFSKNDEKSIDNRKSFLCNRYVPYKLPKIIEQKLFDLMQKLQLNTCSIDIIKSTDGHFVFLEVNPDGIFENVSYFCNYQLEKKIANYLAKKND